MTDQNHNPDHDENDDSHEELTRNDGKMPTGAGDHDLKNEAVDPGYGDGDELIDSSDETEFGEQ